MIALREVYKSLGLIGALSLATITAPRAFAQEDDSPAPKKDSLHNEALQAYGWYLGSQGGLNWDFTEEDKEQIIIGIRRAANGHGAPSDMEALLPRIDKIVSAKAEKFQKEQAEQNKEISRRYLEEALKTEGIEKTENGLVYQIIELGIGAFPKPDDMVRLNYRGRLINGQEFDSSFQRGRPADLVMSNVIPGFREGLQLLREGGRIILYIPPELGYGEEAQQGIPANSVLTFEIDLIEVNPVGVRAPQ